MVSSVLHASKSSCRSCIHATKLIKMTGSQEPLYPQPETIGKYLPKAIHSAYEAAGKVRRIDANAYAVLLGRVVEIICQDRKAQGESLHDKLQDLASRGEIPAELVEMAHGLRQLRNVGAHADLGELNESEITIY